MSTIHANKKRSQEGRQPIRGTAWITPPSYMQSQVQNPPYVPQYTEITNDNDAGYYDPQGIFHPNLKTKEAYHMNTLVSDQTGNGSNLNNYPPPPGPPPNQSNINNINNKDSNVDFNKEFKRYYNNENNDNFEPPSDPPPAHLRN